MRPVFAAVQPVLKDLGYRRTGSTFQRTIEPDGLVHVVEFQRGGFIHTVLGERRVTTQYGGFTVNLGVWLPGVRQQMLVPGNGTTPWRARPSAPHPASCARD